MLFGNRMRTLSFLVCDACLCRKVVTMVRFLTMDSANKQRYEDAVGTLNTLQTNASVLQQAKKIRVGQLNTNVEDTRKYLLRTGISQKMLDSSLSAIHVAGTKGKGSTCAFTESILRKHGHRTGFYSSPHLIAVRERIRIDGKPLSMQKFTQYFWEVYNSLAAQKEHEHDMPPYFKFLTVMALNVFIKEKVDVAVIEVGIGGELDCTNVLRNPVVVGITSLGLDHTSLLGSTVELIAWQKAGILKPKVPAFTVENQPGDSLNVIRQRAEAIGCPLLMAPNFEEYKWPDGKKPILGLDSQVQTLNASIAIQLAHAWMNANNNQASEKSLTHEIPQSTVKGLEQVKWPGRTQTIDFSPQLKIFMDGAHTTDSIKNCLSWFKQASNRGSPKRVLLFNSTGERDPTNLLRPLYDSQLFSKVIFCPNIASSCTADQSNFMVTAEQQLKRTAAHLAAWKAIENEPKSCSVHTFPYVSDALNFVKELSAVEEMQVLVTGSLHLVGCVLGLLDLSDEDV
ncbi:Hypothetical predicted protein [Cloeon dipterum]|uniref:Folylpolyglutamate synthase n=2 Tax=Cloeon dipterum TaxID=197152 RepID=A0A8S1DAA3_9INSE|nr:Hypothetical predicted protein [Cloeon dipterum]